MIITVTCNPAIDRTIDGDKILDTIGGKGVNVSKVLKSLGCESLCTGLLGRENGQLIRDGLEQMKINHHFIEVDGRVRTNTKRIVEGKLFEEYEKGPKADRDSYEKLKDYLQQFHNDIIVIAGSAPANCDENFYAELVKTARDNHNYVILDCGSELMKKALKQHPDAIKPNEDEVLRLFDLKDRDQIIEKCLKLDLDLIIVSLGADGAIFIRDREVYRCAAPDVNYVSAVAAGDAMVAAMAYARENDLSFKELIKLAMAAACASVEMPGSKAPDKEKIYSFIDKVVIEKVR